MRSLKIDAILRRVRFPQKSLGQPGGVVEGAELLRRYGVQDGVDDVAALDVDDAAQTIGPAQLSENPAAA